MKKKNLKNKTSKKSLFLNKEIYKGMVQWHPTGSIIHNGREVGK